MNELGKKIAGKRRDLGMTQEEFAGRMHVTRQTVSRWEAGTILPDIEKIADIAGILGVSCDYLLKDGAADENPAPSAPVSRLLESITGKTVRLAFFDEEADPDLAMVPCRITAFEGSWAKAEAETKKGRLEKLIPVSSIRSVEILKEDE